MVDIYGSHFEYGGKSSRDYGLIISNVDTERLLNLSGSIGGAYVFNKKNAQRYLVDNVYNDFPITFDINFTVDEDGANISQANARLIEKWLFNRHNYRKLYVDEVDDCDHQSTEMIDGVKKRLYLNCRFLNATRLEYNGGIAGYRATLEADSGLWWQDAVSYTFQLNHSSSSQSSIITVNVDTDWDDYVYPKITAVVSSSGTTGLVIVNNTDDVNRESVIEEVYNGQAVIHSDVNYCDQGVGDNFNGIFPRLLDGENSIVVSGKVTSITFEFSQRRYL